MIVHVAMKTAKVIRRRNIDDDVLRFTAETWGRIFEKYVPMDSGTLSQSYRTEPGKVIYDQRYAHYQWEGVSKWGRPLNYSKEQHPLATSHWEQEAQRNKGKEVADAVTAYIRRQ